MSYQTPLVERPEVDRTKTRSRLSSAERMLIVALVGLALGSLLVLLLVLGSSSEPDPAPAPEVTAPVDATEPAGETETPAAPEPNGVPDAVRAMAERIAAAASLGDWEQLATLATEGATPFWAAIDVEMSEAELADHWRAQSETEPIADVLQALVALDDWYETTATDADGNDVSIYVAPRFMHDATPESRAALEAALGADTVEAAIADGQYLGYRLGITADGDWQFFVSGD